MSEDSTPTPLEWVNSLQAHLALAEQHGRTSVQVNVSDFEVLTDVEMRLLTLEAEVARLQARERELEAALRDVINTPVASASALFAALDRAGRTLAAVSAEKED